MVLVAGDLTGACDSAVSCLAGGPVRVRMWLRIPRPAFDIAGRGVARRHAVADAIRSAVERAVTRPPRPALGGPCGS